MKPASTIIFFALIFTGFTAPRTLAGKAKGPIKSKENYKDIIEKAHNLTLQEDRLQASRVLVRVIESENSNKNQENPQKKLKGKSKQKNQKVQDELKKALDDISTIFYTEKTQRLFEYAKSLLRESPQEASEKFSESIKAEPHNILISLWMARLALYQGKCEEADQYTTKALKVNPFYPQTQLIQLQTKACLQDIESLNKLVNEYKNLESTYPLYYHMVLAQKFFSQKQYPQSKYHIEKAKQVDKEFPEIYFWESQILQKQELPFVDAASRYIRNCKIIGATDYLKYQLEPRLCHEYKAFEIGYKNILEQEKKDFQ